VDISQWSTETVRLRSSISANRAFKDWRAGCMGALSFLSEKRRKNKSFFSRKEKGIARFKAEDEPYKLSLTAFQAS
jgi:hypothetical protein